MKDSFNFDFSKGDFVLDGSGNIETVSGVESLKLWINKILRTQYNRYKLYNGTKYGSNIEDLVIGHSHDVDFTESELKREIEKALLKNDDIYTAASTITREKEKLSIQLTLTTAYGTTEEAVTI